jgi:hypothetical protein
MIIEAIPIILNLSFFSLYLLDILLKNFQKINEKIPRILFFLFYFGVFYLFFHLQTVSISLFFDLKKFFFGNIYICISFIVLAIGFFTNSNQKQFYRYAISLMWGPYLFFLLFGEENYTFLNFEFNGLHLLKAQNPIIFLAISLLLYLHNYKAQLSIGALFIIMNIGLNQLDIKQLDSLVESNIVHKKYIPAEFFWEGTALLIEEEMGIYSFVRNHPKEEPIYKFTMKPLRYLKLDERLFAQYWVDKFEYPIVLKNEETISIYELSKSYSGSYFKIEYNYKTGEKWMKGPMF